MEPLNFISLAEAECFKKRVDGIIRAKSTNTSNLDEAYFHTDEWKYNYNYWTGGFKYNGSDTPQWSMDNSTIQSSVITWALDKKTAYNCLLYKIQDKKGIRTVSWSYRNCSAKFVAACRVFYVT